MMAAARAASPASAIGTGTLGSFLPTYLIVLAPSLARSFSRNLSGSAGGFGGGSGFLVCMGLKSSICCGVAVLLEGAFLGGHRHNTGRVRFPADSLVRPVRALIVARGAARKIDGLIRTALMAFKPSLFHAHDQIPHLSVRVRACRGPSRARRRAGPRRLLQVPYIDACR